MVEMGQCATTLGSLPDADAPRAAPSRRAPARTTIPKAERQAILVRTVKLDVIPHLLSVVRSTEAAAPVPAITAADVAGLADLALHGDDGAAAAFVGALRERGVTAEALFLDLLTPVARRLGEWWEQDVCGFTEVTTGLWRLQDAMHGLSPAFLSAAPMPSGPRILLVPMPGEQHTFGLSMVHEFFRRAGWNAWSGSVSSRAELEAAVRRQWVDVVGFSLACDEQVDAARAEIHAVRQASRNTGLFVVVGGPLFVADPDLAASIGADGTAQDGAQAVAMATALLDRRDGRRGRRG